MGDFIMKIAVGFVLLFNQEINKKVNKHFDIRLQFQYSTEMTPNDLNHFADVLKSSFDISINYLLHTVSLKEQIYKMWILQHGLQLWTCFLA